MMRAAQRTMRDALTFAMIIIKAIFAMDMDVIAIGDATPPLESTRESGVSTNVHIP
jgi:hypothetical protein